MIFLDLARTLKFSSVKTEAEFNLHTRRFEVAKGVDYKGAH